MLDAAGHVRLVGLGHAFVYPPPESQRTHILRKRIDIPSPYLPPEYLAVEGGQGFVGDLGTPLDFWAAGATLVDLISAHPPFGPRDYLPELRQMARDQRDLHLPSCVSRSCRDFLHRLTAPEPDARLSTLAEVQAHPWFHGWDWEATRSLLLRPQHVPIMTHAADTSAFPSLAPEEGRIPARI